MEKKFRGSARIFTYNWFYSITKRIIVNRELGELGDGIVITTQTAFMLESYFNHVCQIIYNYLERARIAFEKDESGKIMTEMIDGSYNGEFYLGVAHHLGFITQFEILKQVLCKHVSRNRRSIFNDEFEPVTSVNSDFGEMDSKYRFSPRIKIKALVKSLCIDDQESNVFIETTNNIFSIRDMLAHGRTHCIEGSTTSDLLECEWQEKCRTDIAQENFEKSISLIKAIDLCIDSEVPLGNLQEQFGVIRSD